MTPQGLRALKQRAEVPKAFHGSEGGRQPPPLPAVRTAEVSATGHNTNQVPR